MKLESLKSEKFSKIGKEALSLIRGGDQGQVTGGGGWVRCTNGREYQGNQITQDYVCGNIVEVLTPDGWQQCVLAGQ